MKKNFYSKVYAVALMSLSLILFTLSCLAQGFSHETTQRLQKVIDSFQNNPATPFVGGISAAIKVDGLAQWQGVTGFAARNTGSENNLLAGGTPFTKKTLSRIYSVTKTFTAALVLELAKEGVFSLHDSVGKFIPLNAVNPALSGKVTISQLLAHESGYSDFVDEFNLQVAVAAQPTHIWTPFEIISFVHQVKSPGEERRYASTNYIILGALIEAATGKQVEDLYRKRFFEPLRLGSMYFDIREQKRNGYVLAAPHDNISAFNPVFQATGQPTFPDAYTNISRFPFTAISSLEFTGGGIISTAKDVADWGSALFEGRATSRATLNKMIGSISATPDEDGDRLGYGIFISKKMSATETFIGHDGNAPGYRSVMFYQPDKKLTLVVLTNFHGADIYSIARALYAVVPDFKCGNPREDKVRVCWQGKTLCLPAYAASFLVAFCNARLCDCNNEDTKTAVSPKMQPGIEEQVSIAAYPNPFRDEISFSIRVSKAGPVNLDLYDMTGKLTANLYKGFAEKGQLMKVKYNNHHLVAGMYVCRLVTSTGMIERKLLKEK